jgi:hypothetical protein
MEVGESVELTVTIAGNGNLATLEGPTVSTPGVFEVYDPEIDSRINRTGATVRGTKTFKYILIPRSNGTFEIPPVTFTFLDSGTGQYRTLTSDAHSISVRGSASAASPALATASGLPVDDIPPIVTAAGRWRSMSRRPVYQSPWIWAGLILPLVLLGMLAVYEKATRKLRTDVRYARNLRARPVARKHLKHAEQLRATGDAKGYYDALEKALRGFCGNRLNIGELALTQDELAKALSAAGAGSPTIFSIRELLSECDRVRFAPVAPDQRAMDTAHERASDVIEALNDEIQKAKRQAPAA